MAEQQTQNAPIQDTAIEETLATPEQQQPAPKPARRKHQNVENGNAKRSSTHKITSTEADALSTNGANGATPKKTRAKKQLETLDSAVSTNADAAPDAPPRKRALSRKSTQPTRRKTTKSVKKEEKIPQESAATTEAPEMPEAPASSPVISISIDTTEAETGVAPFEPDLDPTPVKTRETPDRSLASIEAELDALLSELTLEEPPNLEDTMARPALRITSTVDILTDIPETPLLPATEPADIPETPLPTLNEKETLAEISIPAEDEVAWDTVVIEEEIEATIIAAVETPPVIEPERPESLRPRSRRRLLKRAVMLLALFLFATSSLLLWQNINETHLYLYHIDPANGQILAQQDLGGYSSISALSNAAQDQSSVLLGVSSTPSAQQQVLSLSGSNTSWHITQQFATSPGRSTLSIGPEHLLAIENSNGLQVMTSNDRALWQAAGDAPMLGAHPFTPAFDGSTLYTIKSARQGILAAYNIHNGSALWTVQLNDTLNYAPPMLLMGDTLYVAGDHTLYALNTITGGTHWKVATPARTLLYSQTNSPAIIAVGASGLAAFDPQNSNLLWSFNGQPDTSSANGDGNALTAAQFYQASLLTTSNTVYATGLVWDTRQMQQQVWLFAVDAGTGTRLWSEQIGTGFTNADGGRVFAPFIDAPNKLIVIEQAQGDGSHTLSAFDTGDGFQRWNVRLPAVSASTPAIIQLTSDTLGIFSAQTGAGLSLRTGSGLRSLLLILAIASFLSLLLLWMSPLKNWLSNTGRLLRRLSHYLIAPLRTLRRLWLFSRLLFALTLVAAVICAGLLTYTQLNQQRPYIKQVAASNGSAMWQYITSSSAALAGVDNAGALLVTAAGDHTSELSGLTSNGSSRWTISSGEGTFSFPPVATQAGTVLAVLNGPATLPYQYAPEDPAFPNPLAHHFALYLLDSHTGQVPWQNDLVKAGALQDSTVLGADSQFIYVASKSLEHSQVVQLIAVDKTGGETAWRFYGPREQADAASDLGALLTRGNLIYWQVDNAIYALNTQTGQVEWRDAIPEVDAKVSTLEEGQMAAGQGVLLIRRSDMYHALDLVTGAERWTLSGLGVDDAQAPGGIIADGSKFILYGGGTIEAYDATAQNVLWKHIDLVAISNVSLSSDGSLVYAVVFNNVNGGTNVQALVAFDANSNLIHWTFQPDAQAQLIYAGSRIIYNVRGMIYLATCFSSSPGNCNRQILYGIDESTGAAHWNIEARRIYALQVSQDGQTLTFQTKSSAWENLKAIFRG
jgi:outer membrane protein assembly factor BamB